MKFNFKISYSDDWHREGCTFENKIPIHKPVYYRHVYRKSGELAGVIVDFETADDCHFEMNAEGWKKFSDCYLSGPDEEQAVKDFFFANDGMFTFEHALVKAGIEYKKLAFY